MRDGQGRNRPGRLRSGWARLLATRQHNTATDCWCGCSIWSDRKTEMRLVWLWGSRREMYRICIAEETCPSAAAMVQVAWWYFQFFSPVGPVIGSSSRHIGLGSPHPQPAPRLDRLPLHCPSPYPPITCHSFFLRTSSAALCCAVLLHLSVRASIVCACCCFSSPLHPSPPCPNRYRRLRVHTLPTISPHPPGDDDDDHVTVPLHGGLVSTP